jgi:hypothetical protein
MALNYLRLYSDHQKMQSHSDEYVEYKMIEGKKKKHRA